MSEWQPIERAPMDGRRILVAWAGEGTERWPAMEIVFWNHSRDALSGSDGGWGSDRYRKDDGWPTHWMPLPDMPNLTG